MSADELIEQYVKMFGDLPPADMVISYYDKIYLDLIEMAISDREPITPEVLEQAIGNKPYDRDSGKKLTNFKKQG